MAADAFHPRTTKQRLPTPLNGTIYVTTRMVAQEKTLPTIGGTMAAELGPAWADSIVIAVSEPPDKSQGVLSITHVRIPTETEQLGSNWEHVDVPIGGKQYPGVIRSVILLASAYQENSPAINSALPVITGGLFEGSGYFLYDRECVKSGIELEPTFRVDRRTYVSTTTLVGKQAYGERQVVTTEDSIVNDGTAAESGLLISRSSVTPIGNGKSVKETAKVTTWAELTDIQWDDKLNAALKTTEQFVAPPAANATIPSNTSYKIVNQDRSLKIVEVPPTVALVNFHRVTPVRVDLGDLPRELISVNVIWSSQYSVGTQDQLFQAWRSGDNYSLAGKDSDKASSSATIKPDVQFRYRDLATNNLFGELHEFYIEGIVTPATIIAKLQGFGVSSQMWPVFFPESFTMTANGQSITVSVNASVGLGSIIENGGTVGQSRQSGTSDDFSAGITTDNIDIPPCIHGEIIVTGGTSQSQVVSATALITMSHTDVGSIVATKTKTGTAYGTVSPAVIPATGGASSIPSSGNYILDFNVAQYKWENSYISVTLFDSSVLAP